MDGVSPQRCYARVIPLLAFPVDRHAALSAMRRCPLRLTRRLLSYTVPLEELPMGRRVGQTALDNRIRQRRQAAGLSQQALATRCGLTRQAINAIEAGQYVPSTLFALRLARTLGSRVEDLFHLPEEYPRAEAEWIGEVPVEA